MKRISRGGEMGPLALWPRASDELGRSEAALFSDLKVRRPENAGSWRKEEQTAALAAWISWFRGGDRRYEHGFHRNVRYRLVNGFGIARRSSDPGQVLPRRQSALTGALEGCTDRADTYAEAPCHLPVAEIVPDPNGPFKDCGNGTVADPQTGLQWEKKTGTLSGVIFCVIAGCPDPHVVNNLYKWSTTGTVPDGGAFTDFLSKLDDPTYGTAPTANDVTGCFAARCDWRVPTIVELQTIADCGFGPPCIDPIFGPTPSSQYFSGSSFSNPNDAWDLDFSDGSLANAGTKGFDRYFCAVRTGACN